MLWYHSKEIHGVCNCLCLNLFNSVFSAVQVSVIWDDSFECDSLK
jgi:hypothetical protein